jgi:hypothetical protein
LASRRPSRVFYPLCEVVRKTRTSLLSSFSRAISFGSWTTIGAEQTASGYEVAWKVAGADQYTVWNTDSSGNFVSNMIGVVSGTSAALESLETSFHQDLNNDGQLAAGLGNGGSGAGNLALFTNYLASTFVTPAGEGTGAVAGAQASDQEFLAKPIA